MWKNAFLRCFAAFLGLVYTVFIGANMSCARESPPSENGCAPKTDIVRCFQDDAVESSAVGGLGRGGTKCGAGIKIFVTNDVHGHVFEKDDAGRIGLAKLRGAVEAAKEAGFHTILMDAGDAFSGSAAAQFDNGRSIAALMGRVGYTVLVPGNHAFDFNLSQNDSGYYFNVLLPLVRRYAASPVEVPCINLSIGGKTPPGVSNEPVTVWECEDVRLIVVGVITPYIATKSNREGLHGYDFGLITANGAPDHAATRKALLDRLTAALQPYDKPGDIVVVLAHVGFDAGDDYLHGEITGKDLASVGNVDFVVDAHSHNVVPAMKVGEAYYGLAGRYLENLAEITITREGGDVRGHMEIIGYDQMRNRPASQETLSMLREVSDRMGLGEQLFWVSDGNLLSDAGINMRSTPLGRFLCRGMAEISAADLAVYNSGGIRSGLPEGWVTVGAVYDMIPFQNNLVSFPMTGAAITAFFAAMPGRGGNAFPQFYGMRVFAWDDGAGGALSIAGILDRDGKPLEHERLYSVAANSFIAYGGDGYNFSMGGQVRDFGDCASELATWFKSSGAGDLEVLRDADALTVFPTREMAEQALLAAAALSDSE